MGSLTVLPVCPVMLGQRQRSVPGMRKYVIGTGRLSGLTSVPSIRVRTLASVAGVMQSSTVRSKNCGACRGAMLPGTLVVAQRRAVVLVAGSQA